MDLVLNWFMQGAIVAILAAAALRLVPQTRAQARYGVLWTAYLLVLVLPTVPIATAIATGGAPIDLVPAAIGPVVTMPTTWWTSAAVAAGLWIVWSCIQATRLTISAFGVWHARRRSRECSASVLARFPQWSRVSATGRPARVILSDRVPVAAVLGCGKPAIALAPALIDQLDVKDLDRVLVHEWAHVQRRDDVAQFVQRLVGIAIGWHPAAWWLERQLDFERELACDEIAVSVTGSAKAYATCLAMLAARPESRLVSVRALAVASPSRLRARIVRILALARDARPRPWRAITVGVGSGLLACSLFVADLELVRSAVTSAVVTTAFYVPRLEPIATHQGLVLEAPAQSEAPAQKEPARKPIVTRPRELPMYQAPSTQEVLPRLETTGAVSEPPTPLEAFAPLPAAALPIHATGSLVAMPVESGRLGQADDESSSWELADVGVEVGRASRVAGTATAEMFRRFSVKLARSF